MKKTTIYIVGNSLVREDSLSLRWLPKLKKDFPNVSFVHFDPTEEFEGNEGNELILIDTVIGIDTITLFHDLTQFVSSPRFTVHDYDLFLQLILMKKIGKLKKLTLIGVPTSGSENSIYKELKSKLFSIAP